MSLFKEPDFAEDENIYDDLNLEEEEELWGIANDDHHSSHDSITDGGIFFKNIIYHHHNIIKKIPLYNILFILGISYTEPRTPQKEARIDI